jgi:hypothetical protein
MLLESLTIVRKSILKPAGISDGTIVVQVPCLPDFLESLRLPSNKIVPLT